MLVVRSRRVILPEGEHPAAVYIDKGVFERIVAYDADNPTGSQVFNVPDLIVSPGIVDTHVHVNQPGRTDWEGFDTATRAAAAGGVTTVVDMPLHSIPATTTVAALRAKRESARAQCHVDVGFWGGVVPGNASELEGLIDAGVRGFKCVLAPSGVDEFQAVGEADLRLALPILARRKMPLLVHAEAPAFISHPADPTYQAYLASRPPEAELEAIRLMIRLAGEFRVSTHILHVSSAEGVDAIARAKRSWVPITAETCPHYLTFVAGRIPDGATEFKCAPPIRDESHRDALWEGLDDGTLDMVVTDHSPSPPSLKAPGNFIAAWGGIASLELTLPATWTAAREQFVAQSFRQGETDVEPEGGFRPSAAALARWMSERPAALAGLSEKKGRIAPGLDADLVVWDPDAARTVDAPKLQQRHKVTPYAGRTLFGKIVTTFVRGERVWDKRRLARLYSGAQL